MGYSAGCMSCVKFMLFATNFLAWLFGIVVFGLSIWIRVDETFKQFIHTMDFEYYYYATYILMAVGFLMFILGFFACCGVVLENVCMISTYFIFLFVMFVLELAAAAYILTNGTEFSKLDGEVEESLQYMIHNYNDDYIRLVMDNLQATVKCCGVHNFDDYDHLNLPIPESCFNPTTGLIYKRDCYEGFIYYVEKKSGILGGFALGLCILHILGMLMSLYLCMAYRYTEESFA